VKPVLLLTRKMLPIMIALLLAGCAADRYRQEGLALIKEGHLDEGLAKLSLAKQTDSHDASIRTDWLLQRDAIIAQYMNDGKREEKDQHWDQAQQRFNHVLNIDPSHIAARQAIAEIVLERKQASRLDDAVAFIKKGEFESANNLVSKVLIESPDQPRALELRSQLLESMKNDSLNGISLNLKGRKPVTLQFREANLRMVMEAISKTTGLNVMFDKDVKSDVKVTIFVRDTPVEEAIDLILMQTQTTKRIMSENSILVYPDTEIKGREYAELKIRRFSLTNADPKQVMAMVKAMVKTKDTFIDEKTNALIVRDTPQVIRLVEKLVSTMDQPEPEVMLEVDVMEISRNRLLALGIDLPTSLGASTNGMTLQQFRNTTAADFTVNGNITIKASTTDSDINDLATPRIRVRNKEKAKFLVGDRLPVISTAAVPGSAGTSGNTGTISGAVYNTNVQYVEVGIKIEVEPTIYADGEVAIRLALEVSSAGDPNPLAAQNGTIAYPISTRSVNTVLRLKDGQTEILGGLIQDQDRASATRIPGLGNIPLLGRLFGSQQDTKNKKEIVLSITPRIVRNNKQVESDLLEMWSGTENSLRFGSKVVGSSKGQSLVNAPSAAALTPSLSPRGLGAIPVPVKAAVGQQPVANASLLKPVGLVVPQSAKPGEQILMALTLPTLPPVNNLDLMLSYDPSRLKFLSVQEADAERNSKAAAHFSGEAVGSDTVHIELSAGRGEILPATGGSLAQLQFEVLETQGPTQVSIASSSLRSADGSEQVLPGTPSVALEVKAAP